MYVLRGLQCRHHFPTNYAIQYWMKLCLSMICQRCSFDLSSQGMTLLMMGSAEALPEEPAVRPMFVEDMTEEQLASAVSFIMA